MKLLIYREDSKVLTKDSELPEIYNDDYEEIKKFILENMGFHIVLSGIRTKDYLVAKRIFGPVNSGYIFEDIVNPKFKDLIDRDIEFWQNKALQIIERLFGLFRKANLELFLFGGWGVDFLTGKVTRPHVDIDLFAWFKDKEAIRKLLMENSFSPREKGTKFQIDNGGFDIYFLDPEHIAENPHGFIESAKFLNASVLAKLNGIKVRVVNPVLFRESLEKKLKYIQANNKIYAGPIEKTAHDLDLVEKYLQKSNKLV